MKTLVYISFSFFITALFTSCIKETEIPVPTACVETFLMLPDGKLQPQTTFKVGEVVIFKACAKARQYVVWPGDQSHNYDLDHGGKYANSGIAFDAGKGTLAYSYSEAGKYKVVFYAINTQVAGEPKVSKVSFDIVITE